MKVNTDMFKAQTRCSCWSSAVLIVASVMLNLISLLIATRIWCFKRIVYDIGGKGLGEMAVKHNPSPQLMADLNTSCMHPTSGYGHMEKGLAILINASSELGYDPISDGNHQDINRHLWDAEKYKATRARFWTGWGHHVLAQIVAVYIGYFSFGIVLLQPIRRRCSINAEKNTLIAHHVIDTVSSGAALVHYGFVYFKLGGISRLELNFFFSLTEYFTIGWSSAVAGFVLARFGGIMGVKHIHRDAVRAGEIHEKKDLTKNPLLMKIQDQERAKKAAGGGNGGGGNVGPGQGRRVGGGNDLDSIFRDRGYDSVGRRGGRDVSVGNGNGMNPSAAGRNKPNAVKEPLEGGVGCLGCG